MAVTKKEFADRMAENGGTTKKAAYKAVDAFIDTLMDYLGEGEKVMLMGFGRFEVRTAKERVGRNPRTGEEYMIPEHGKVKFVPSEGLADRIKERSVAGTDEDEWKGHVTYGNG